MRGAKLLSILFTVSVLVEVVKGQCTTATGGQGQCKLIYNCEPLLEAAKSRSKGYQELLKKSQCGFLGKTPKVCCPEQVQRPPPPPQSPNDQCYTPDFKPGKCVGAYSCPHLASLLKEPISDENMEYLKRLRCDSQDPSSVCCRLVTKNRFSHNDYCKATISALPPEPSSECCGLDSSFGNKIYGGTATGIDEYPWLALIEYDTYSMREILCGGSLISSKYVLTAAHCVTGVILKSGTPARVRLGEYDRTNEGPDCVLAESGGEECTRGAVRIPIEQAISHPEYRFDHSYRRNDIALIRMSRLAPYTEFIRPICLPKTDVITLTADYSTKLLMAGWGATNVTARSPIKQDIELPFVAQDQCQQLYNRLPSTINFWRGQLCAGGEEGKDSCKGDSGGPLMLVTGRRHDAVGVASFGHKQCGTENVPGVYTSVYEYDNWIRSNIFP